jgi:hypothetical protein
LFVIHNSDLAVLLIKNPLQKCLTVASEKKENCGNQIPMPAVRRRKLQLRNKFTIIHETHRIAFTF